MAARLVNVLRAFTLSIVRDGQVVVQRIEAGIQRLEDDVASHWYTQAHSAEVPKGVKKSNAEAAEEARKAAEDAELARMEAEEKATLEAAAAAEAEAAKAAGSVKK
jgi:hypothetical protein